MTKLFAIIKFHWLHELSNKYYMYKHNIQHHCYKACMTNCYPVEPLPFFSPSLHKFNWEFYPSIRTEDEACTLGVVHNATDINLLFCFLLQTDSERCGIRKSVSLRITQPWHAGEEKNNCTKKNIPLAQHLSERETCGMYYIVDDTAINWKNVCPYIHTPDC